MNMPRSGKPPQRAFAASILAIATIAAFYTAAMVHAQSLTYSSGQNVSPAFEGWEQAPDGARYFLFGYMNRNWEEEVDVAVGPDNGFGPSGGDMGQPTHFLPRRNRFVFRVKVPDGFTEKDELVWVLTTKGKTERAYATLRSDYQVDDVVKASETGALGAGTSSPEVRANKAPAVKIQAKSVAAKVGQPVTLTAIVSDDGVPKPRAPGLVGSAVSNPGSVRDRTTGPQSERNPVRVNRAMQPPFRSTVGKNVGLHVSWFVYRGAGKVTFDPEQIAAWEDTRAGANSPWSPIWTAPEVPVDGKLPVSVVFAEPGTYVLRARADDGALMSDDELTVTVTR